MDLTEAGNITRLKTSPGLKLAPGTTLRLCYRWSERQQNAGSKSKVVELFLRLRNKDTELDLETDTVLNWDDLPRLAGYKDSWSKVGGYVNGGLTPDDAYLRVAMELLQKRWRYEVDMDVNSEIEFYIVRKNPEATVIVAKINDGQFGTFFLIDHDAREARINEFIDKMTA